MKNPTSKQFKKVINNFIKVLPRALFNGNLIMGECRVEKNICGTPMCHGGWYAVASDVEVGDFETVDYSHGAQAMANALGFNHTFELREWAEVYPILWGNDYGYDMFCCNSAFNNAKTLRGVVNHWIGVHNRTCPKAEPINKIK
jgi:hypothetical protein